MLLVAIRIAAAYPDLRLNPHFRELLDYQLASICFKNFKNMSSIKPKKEFENRSCEGHMDERLVATSKF